MTPHSQNVMDTVSNSSIFARDVPLPFDRHPSAANKIIYLFHGTQSLEAAQGIYGTNLRLSTVPGEFNTGVDNQIVHGRGGAAYLTDSLVNAAQFACYGKRGLRVANVHVIHNTGGHVLRFDEHYGNAQGNWRFYWEKFMTNNLKRNWAKVWTQDKHYYESVQHIYANFPIIEGPMLVAPGK
ncbi:hypothetical protein D9758_017636 [Tetrapyrgos nigripes]|uniref:Uncharacterized protein n=1 Tax=Tetrapyrgos nigripes TaxID=182062 RepID=A0A8H5CHB5_9AGAR|nr:hypothetical protein D9758_017636 [Tetrapyrgos nigripes]